MKTPPSPRLASATSPPSPRRILLVDDHPMMRLGLTQLLASEPGLEVAAAVGTAEEAVSAVIRTCPDLVITDLSLPGRTGLELIKDLHTLNSRLPILVLSMHDEMLYAERVLRAGARGYLMKEASDERIFDAIRAILAGQIYVSPRMSARILDLFSGQRPRGSDSPIQKLSDREFEVFQLIGQGKTTREIAAQLRLSAKTVDVHRSHIKEKLGLVASTELVRFAVRWLEAQSSSR